MYILLLFKMLHIRLHLCTCTLQILIRYNIPLMIVDLDMYKWPKNIVFIEVFLEPGLIP